MKTILTIAKRELKAYFVTPIAYVYLTTFLTVTHWLFFRGFFIQGQADLRNFFNLMPWIFLFFLPAVSMGKWSEERKLGTIELLMTLPIKEHNVIVAKFLASLGLLAIALFLTFMLPLTVIWLGNADVGPILCGYLGLLLMGGAYLAIGLWISSLTDNQIIAFILSVVVCFAFLIIGEPIVTSGLPLGFVSIFQYLGLAGHFASIERGVIDSRDIFYYASLIFFFLFLNLKTLAKQARKVLISTAIITLFALHLISARHFVRLDLTQNNLYTLGDSTKKLLKNLEDVVTIRLYFSRNLPPALQRLHLDVEDVLSEFKTYSKNKVKIEYYNPQENPVEEQKILMKGIPPVEVMVIEKDKQELAKVYLGMTVNHLSKEEILAVIQNTSNLEYRLAAAIVKVTQREEPQVGWWVPQNQNNYSILTDQIKDRFKIVAINDENLDQLDPKNFATLVFIVGEKLSEREKKALKNYLSVGGKAIILAEQASVSLNELKPSVRENPIQDILKDFGITILQDLVLDASNATATFTGGVVNYQIPYPYWVLIRPENFNRNEPMVSELNGLVLPWASSIETAQDPPQGHEVEILFQTTPHAVTTAIKPEVPLDPQNAKDVLANAEPKQIPLGMMVDKKIIVIPNQAFLSNTFLQQFEANLVFFENALDVFSTGDLLVGIRSKGQRGSPLTPLPDTQRTFTKIFNLLLAPILLVFAGALFHWKRRLVFKKWQREFAK